MKVYWLGIVIGFIVGLFVPLPPFLHAQKAEKGTQQWRISLDNAYGGITGTVQVHVIDTTGVCLYIVRDSTTSMNNVAIAAVPKTALPQAAGCQ
jgi:hypothetical protein